ncbi:restriction endonuclease subunit S [Macrococcus hajekii]|uniref:Restriction endonuclease subunit S n=1 Tax=Macrococcus hajekii TaxID=198482 RepID=A0A4R6BLT0_9STAP|nr:restriction endonuclease subunit S [Macrococcus hajekii]TDM02759.1 restriction endonuclease subunit S [Macrococcus hajekii]GGB03656.1 type I restriction endonuclease [Macrococcus hajekii]
MSEKNENIPKRRFKEFENAPAWEQRELGKIGRISTGNTPSTKYADYYSEDGMLWITPTDIKNNITTSSERKLSVEGIQKARKAPGGSILVTCIASIGKNTLIEKECGYNQQINALAPYSKYDSYFLLTQSKFWSLKMSNIAASGTMQIVNKREFSKLNFLFPNNDEQIKIGKLFKELDNAITLHQRKLNKLKNTKEAYLNELFPAEGERKPKRRFSNYTDEWKSIRWSESVNISTEMVNPQEIQYQYLPHVGPGNIESFTGRILNNVKLVKDENLISGKFRFRPDDIVYGKINPQLAKYSYATFDGLTSADAYVLRSNRKLDQSFLYCILHTKYFYNYSVSVSKRSGMPKINRAELGIYEFFAPSLEEQRCIGKLFLRLDKTINNQYNKIEKLRNLKKSYLEELFV